MKKIIAYLLLVCMLVTAIPLSTEAAAKVKAKGKGYDGIRWTLYTDGTLEVSGTGKMENHSPAGAGWGSWIDRNVSSKYNWNYTRLDVKHVVVASGLSRIGESAFAYCGYNVSAEIGTGVKIIGGWAFCQNDNLKTVRIPKSVKEIGTMAFHNCDNLTDVYYGGTKAQWKKIKVGSQNEDLLNANIHYNQPEIVGNYIHLSDKKPKNVKGILSRGDAAKISWKKVSGAAGYNVYCKKSSESSYTKAPKYTTKLSYTFSNLAGSTKYTFKVVPCFTASKVESEQYTQVSVTTLAKPSSPTIEKVSNSKIKVVWSKMDGADGYQISKSTKKTGTSSAGTTTATSKTLEVKKNTTYYYKIRAYQKVNGNKVYTAWSDPVSNNLRYVYAPSNVSAALIGADDVKVSWKKASGANSYDVYIAAQNNNYTLLDTTSKTSIKVNNLQPGTKYTFKVVPKYVKDGVVLEGKSKTDSVTTLKKVNTPVVTTAKNKVRVRWENIDGEAGYQISKSTKATGTNVVSTYKTTKGTSKTITATKGKTYYYKVRAYQVSGKNKIYGEWSDAVAYTR